LVGPDDAVVTGVNGSKATVARADPGGEPSAYGVTMPAASVAHFVNDLRGHVYSQHASGDPVIDAVTQGDAEFLGKGDDAARFREKSELLTDGVRKRLVDSRGFLGLSADAAGRLRSEDTADMAVACYRNPALGSVASSAVRRLLERDFETDYGPRTVPTSNRMYFSGAYGEGQLGGCWTRAALAFACLSYAAGLPGIGSLSLEKASKLVYEDSIGLGGVPGEFPYWVDIEGREAHGDGSDPVAGARFVQAVVEGELGFSSAPAVPAFDPPATSAIKWVIARNLWTGEPVSLFVGRSAGRSFAFACCQRVELEGGRRFAKSEQVGVSPRSAHAISFHGPGQVVCVGSSSSAPMNAKVTVPGRSPGLVKRLSTPLEEFEPARGAWNRVGSLRVSPTMTFDAPLGPGGWKVYRISDD
jgi:hypothetical protein